MKKRILAIALVVVLSLSVFAGCGLMTQNNNRVGEEAVVTIGSGVNEQIVTRNEVVNAFNSYGQLYIQYFQMTTSQVMQLIINNLTSPKVIVYLALENLPKVSAENDDSIYDAYFTAEELAEIDVELVENISGVIDAIEKEALTKDIVATDMPKYRATPTGYAFTSNIPMDFEGTTSRASAIAAFERSLSNSGMTYEQYVTTLAKALKQNKISSKYQESITGTVVATDADVMVRYNSMLEKENEQYAISADSYEAKLSEISSNKAFSNENFILNVPTAGYGFAMNLLIGYDAETQAKIDAVDAELKEEKITAEEATAKKKVLFAEITATDERIDWLKQYGTTSELFDDYAFDGTATPKLVDGIQVMGEKGEYSFESLTSNEYTINEFTDKVQSEMKATKGQVVDGFQMYNTDIAMKNTFMELMWAYNDDTAGNGNAVGYVCYADPESSSYVPEYANASKAVVEAGVGAYTVVATDFGWHIIYCVEAYNTVGVENTYNASEKDVEGTFSNLFFNSVNEAVKANHMQQVVSDMQNNGKVEIELHEDVMNEIMGA